eukprot:3690431-Pleurochrysis_carterae.AAC.1
MSAASTAFAVTLACATNPERWKAKTVVSSHVARIFTPPTRTCPSMSVSAHPSCSATRRWHLGLVQLARTGKRRVARRPIHRRRW